MLETAAAALVLGAIDPMQTTVVTLTPGLRLQDLLAIRT